MNSTSVSSFSASCLGVNLTADVARSSMSSNVRSGSWRKRKDRDSSDAPLVPPPAGHLASAATQNRAVPMPSQSTNLLLAGCLAQEFLTRGTLLGKRWEVNGLKPSDNNESTAAARPRSEAVHAMAPSSYAEVSVLLKADGTRIPGVFNPTQLARWLQM